MNEKLEQIIYELPDYIREGDAIRISNINTQGKYSEGYIEFSVGDQGIITRINTDGTVNAAMEIGDTLTADAVLMPHQFELDISGMELYELIEKRRVENKQN
jgi:hypothetical protein